MEMEDAEAEDAEAEDAEAEDAEDEGSVEMGGNMYVTRREEGGLYRRSRLTQARGFVDEPSGRATSPMTSKRPIFGRHGIRRSYIR
jgi:hypothetical protein